MSQLFYFDLDLAVEYGVDEAILMHNFIFWISKNKENGTNGHDGRTWTHQTIRELSEKFPFWTEKQIYRIVKSCVSQGLIRKGNFNKIGYDRTIWYALNDESLLPSYKENVGVSSMKSSSGDLERSNFVKTLNQFTRPLNGSAKKDRPIPYSTTISTSYNTPHHALKKNGKKTAKLRKPKVEEDTESTQKSESYSESYDSDYNKKMILKKQGLLSQVEILRQQGYFDEEEIADQD